MVIKVFGSDCALCAQLESMTRQAVASLGLTASVEQVRDFSEILGYGVIGTPALLVDGRVVVSGRLPSQDEISRLLAEAAPN
jgi:small redox-active disulfide protein 2